MDIFWTKTPKNHFLRIKLLTKIIFRNFFDPYLFISGGFKIEDFEFFVDILAKKVNKQLIFKKRASIRMTGY